LADDYRRVGKNADVLAVVERMYRKADREATRHPKDNARRFHLVQCARTLVAEYEYGGRVDDAEVVRQQTPEQC
jgi:hypothetical protein